MALETLIAPASEPVTLSQARAYLRVGTDGDDGVLTSLIKACREALEARTGRALVTQTLRQTFLVSERSFSILPGTLLPGRTSATALVAARIINADGTETAAPTGLVTLANGRFVLNRALSPNALGLSLDYQAGYGPPASVPEAFKVALLEAIGDALIRRDADTSGDGGRWEGALNEVKL
jgi:uncharacterized phiE125 gp8 family phage protein